MNEQQIPVLENWSVTVDAFRAPELSAKKLTGEVYGHPNAERFYPGKRITTSPYIGRDGDIVTTQTGSRYRLGGVNPEYGREFPNAKERLLSSLPEVAQ